MCPQDQLGNVLDVGKLIFLPRSLLKSSQLRNDQVKVKGFVTRIVRVMPPPSWREKNNNIYELAFDDKTYLEVPLRMMYERQQPLYSPGVLVLQEPQGEDATAMPGEENIADPASAGEVAPPCC